MGVIALCGDVKTLFDLSKSLHPLGSRREGSSPFRNLSLINLVSKSCDSHAHLPLSRNKVVRFLRGVSTCSFYLGLDLSVSFAFCSNTELPT